jgi:hypothetical protein
MHSLHSLRYFIYDAPYIIRSLYIFPQLTFPPRTGEVPCNTHVVLSFCCEQEEEGCRWAPVVPSVRTIFTGHYFTSSPALSRHYFTYSPGTIRNPNRSTYHQFDLFSRRYFTSSPVIILHHHQALFCIITSSPGTILHHHRELFCILTGTSITHSMVRTEKAPRCLFHSVYPKVSSTCIAEK